MTKDNHQLDKRMRIQSFRVFHDIQLNCVQRKCSFPSIHWPPITNCRLFFLKHFIHETRKASTTINISIIVPDCSLISSSSQRKPLIWMENENEYKFNYTSLTNPLIKLWLCKFAIYSNRFEKTHEIKTESFVCISSDWNLFYSQWFCVSHTIYTDSIESFETEGWSVGLQMVECIHVIISFWYNWQKLLRLERVTWAFQSCIDLITF